MSRVVLLDTAPLGLVTNPRRTPETLSCNRWLEMLLINGIHVSIPEIADYEVRRELLRAGKTTGLRHLDRLQQTLDYLPLTTETMLKAAEFCAQVRRQGQPTADTHALDGDVILAAQAAILIALGEDVVVATTNVGHLARLVPAKAWQNITV